MNSSSFRSSFIINNEQIEPNLNSIFAIKYGKIQCSLRNYNKFQKIENSLISLLRIFIYNVSIRKKYVLSGFNFDHFESHQSYPQFFLGFKIFNQ
jgi:hypothetical protein